MLLLVVALLMLLSGRDVDECGGISGTQSTPLWWGKREVVGAVSSIFLVVVMLRLLSEDECEAIHGIQPILLL